jgi:hypothetical protein
VIVADELVPRLQAYIRAKDPQGSAGLETADYVLRFSSLGAPQELRIHYVPQNSWTIHYKARVPDATERCFIESKWVWFPEHSGCRKVQLAPLDSRYKLFASDEPFFRSIFEGRELSDALMQLPAENHFKASLKDETLSIAWKLRFNPKIADRDGILLQSADTMVLVGGQLFKHIQVARMMRR